MLRTKMCAAIETPIDFVEATVILSLIVYQVRVISPVALSLNFELKVFSLIIISGYLVIMLVSDAVAIRNVNT
jgi:hypothetical protein